MNRANKVKTRRLNYVLTIEWGNPANWQLIGMENEWNVILNQPY